MTAKRKPDPTICGQDVKPEKWTWQMAEEALAKNVSNRHIRDSSVAQYQRLMQDSLWGTKDAKQGYRSSSQFVIFDWDGNLIDGQHRLYAQVRSKTTQYHYVLRDVPPSTQHYIDIGTPRSAADALKFQGYQNYIILGSVSRWAWLLEQGLSGSRKVKVSNDEVLDMVERHPDLTHSAEYGAYSRGGFVKVNPSPVGAAHWWIAQHNDHNEADMFVERMVQMNREQPGSAILALLKRFSEAKEKREHIQTRVQIAMIVKAWNLDVERTYVSRLPSRSRSGEFQLPEVAVRIESQEDSFGPLGDEDENELIEGEGELDAGEEGLDETA